VSVYDIPLHALDGSPLDASQLRGKAALIVNVASRCGLTPQYEALQALYERYRDRGFVVVGAPCNQFAGQEPGAAEEIASFCSDSYSVEFPLTEKLDVNGRNRHPLYAELTALPDANGVSGDVQWNFEKFLVSPAGEPVARHRPKTLPDSEEIVSAIEALLPTTPEPAWVQRTGADVRPGDRVRVKSGIELTVTRIEAGLMGAEDYVCLIEDSAGRWLAQPVKTTGELEILSY
jgi:glutathione peroxidase